MANVKVNINWQAVDAACSDMIRDKTAEIYARTGGASKGYSYDVRNYDFPGSKNARRTHGLVYTVTIKAMVDNRRHNTILKAAQG